MHHESERDWGVTRRTAWLLFVAPFLGIALCGALRLLNKPLWLWIEDENGPLEMFQFVGLALSSLLCVLIARRLMRRRLGAALLYALAAAALFFVAGEEVAWGQFWLDFETPEELVEINEKGELSLHNIPTVESWFNAAKFAAALYGGLGWWGLLWLRRRWDAWRLEIFVVPAFLSSSFLAIVLTRLLRWTVLQGYGLRGFGEVEEACFVFGTAAFAALVWRRLGDIPRSSPEPARRRRPFALSE